MIEGEISDISGLRRVIASHTLDVNRFVRNTTRNGSDSVSGMVEKLGRLSSDASSKMKRAIFDNYQLFIRAGKAASELEANMHQIHNDFTEKQQVMDAMAEISLFNDALPMLNDSQSEKVTRDEADAVVLSEFAGSYAKELVNVIDNASSFTDDPTRRVILDGELRELSVDTYTFICVARLFLLNDSLVIAYSHHKRSAKMPYRVQAVYSLESVVTSPMNSRDRRHSALNAFRISVNKASRVFQAETTNSAQLWLRLLDETKRASSTSRAAPRTSADPLQWSKVNRKTSSDAPAQAALPVYRMPANAVDPANASSAAVHEAFKALSATLPECANLLTPPSDSPSTLRARKNPFADSNAVPPQAPASDQSSSDIPKNATAWLWDVPEDLDVAISERDFKRATQLVIQAQTQLKKLLQQTATDNESTATGELHALTDFKPHVAWLALSKRVAVNESNLAEALQYELITAADRHGAPKAIDAAVLYLGQLGKANLAAQLFLIYRSKLLSKMLTRGVRQEGNQLVYLNRLSFAFHRNLAETAAAWSSSVVKPLLEQSNRQRSIDQTKPLLSEQVFSLRFCSWVLEETDRFSQQLRILLVDSRSVSFYSMALAAKRITAHAEKMTELLGVDVRSVLHANLMRTWQRAAEGQADVLRDAVENRAKQETWDRMTSETADEQDKYLRDLKDTGLFNKRSAALGLPLTLSTCQFIRSLYYFVQAGDGLGCGELVPILSQCIAKVLAAELANYERTIADPNLVNKKSYIRMNLEFLTTQAIPKLLKPLYCLNHPDIVQVHTAMNTLLERYE